MRQKGRRVMMARASAGQIVVGIDGSAAAAAALRWAAAEARSRGVRLHVVYVRDLYRPEPAPYALPGDSYADDLPVPPETALRQAVHAALGPDLPPGCLLEAAEGLPVRVLLDRAEGARLLVLGSRLAGIRRPDGPTVPLGPVVRDCVRGAPCPVVVVPPGYAESPASPVAGLVSRDAEPGAGSQDLPEAQPGG